MHELSIANSLIEIATEQVSKSGGGKVQAINLQIGALSCVHRDALLFSFELVSKDTMLEGANLNIDNVPVTIYCRECDREVELPGIQIFRCPHCETPSAAIRRGKELDIVSIEILENEPTQVN